MTRKQAGIIRQNQPTRATKRGSLNRYCRSMKHLGGGLHKDAYGQKYQVGYRGTRKV